MSQNKKFLFDLNNFDAPDNGAQDITEEEIEPAPPPPPTFSEDELDGAKASAHAAGIREGMAEERRRREQKTSDLLDKIAENFSSLFAAERYRERQYEEESVRLGIEIINIIAPPLIQKFGHDIVRNILIENLKKQSQQSEIIIELHPDQKEDIEKIIAVIWQDETSPPRCKIVTDDTIQQGECRLKWADGGLIRDPAQTAEQIRDELQSLLTEKENDAINKEGDSQISESLKENGERHD